jgi:prepilin-type N-terminal cleavage/methylation domain-containing protein
MDPKRFLNLNSLFMKTGFTLIEVTVTLTILGFILLIIFGAFRLGLSAWERGESTREDYQKLRTVSDLVSRQIKSTVAYKIKTEKAEGDYLAFEGKSNTMKFVSALSIKAKQPEGFVYVIYEFKEGGEEEGRLVLYEQRVLNKDFMDEEPKEGSGSSVLEGISSMTFEYFRESDPLKGQEEGWVDEWSAKEEKKLPKAIRAKITYKNGKNEKERPPLNLLASIPAYRFEEVKAGLMGAGRRTIQQRIQP